MLSRFVQMAAIAVLATGFATTAAAEQWNMATPYPDASFHTQNDYQFVKDIEKNSDLSVTVHSAGSLIKHTQIKRAVQTGQVQLGEIFISILGNENPIYAVDSVPFLATSYEDARALWEASRGEIEKLLAADGIQLLYAVPWPAQGLYVSKPVDDIADLKGLKARAYNKTTARLDKLLGMVPTQVEVPEVPQAFSTGIIDAMITSPTTGVNTKAWDYVNRFYNVQAWLPKNMIVVNKRAFDALPEKTRQAVLDAAKAAEKRGWEVSKKQAKAEKKVLEEHGMKVLEPSDKLMDGLRKVGQELTQQWLDETGKAGQAIIDAYDKDKQ